MAAEILPKLDRFARVLPILRWLPGYEAGWFRADVIAGLTLWGILVPEGIAYAGLAGAPVQAGLYTLLASLIAYAILGTTRQAVSAPTSGSSIMMATVVAPFLVTGPGELAELLGLLVLVVGIIFLLCGLVRLGFVIAFISHSVMTGFVFGLAIYIAVSQVSKLFGLPRGPATGFEGRDLASFLDGLRRDPDRYAFSVNQNVLRNGEKVWTFWANKGIYDDRGQVKEVLRVGLDITERERRLEAATEELREITTMLEGRSWVQ